MLTEWNEIKAIKPEDYQELMRTPLVYDGRNIYRLKEMRQAGVEYYSIGRKSVRRIDSGKTAANNADEGVPNHELQYVR